jgi:hypothetical protein
MGSLRRVPLYVKRGLPGLLRLVGSVELGVVRWFVLALPVALAEDVLGPVVGER